MADKLVPGIPEAVKIAILQQTDAETESLQLKSDAVVQKKGPKTVLQQVLESDVSRNEVHRKIERRFKDMISL